MKNFEYQTQVIKKSSIMKRLFLIFLCMHLHGNDSSTTLTTAQLEAQKEAIDIVAAISENLAALIIHHKQPSDPERTKHHSIELVKSITKIITQCIMQAKTKKAQSPSVTRGSNILLYDQTTLDAIAEQIAQSIVQTIENAEGNA